MKSTYYNHFRHVTSSTSRSLLTCPLLGRAIAIDRGVNIVHGIYLNTAFDAIHRHLARFAARRVGSGDTAQRDPVRGAFSWRCRTGKPGIDDRTPNAEDGSGGLVLRASGWTSAISIAECLLLGGNAAAQVERLWFLNFPFFYDIGDGAWEVVSELAQRNTQSVYDLRCELDLLVDDGWQRLTMLQMARNQITTVMTSPKRAASSRTTPSTVIAPRNSSVTYK